jgi:hypothetical protein
MARRAALALTLFYLPNVPQYISHQPDVKGFRHHDGDGPGLRLMYTWLDR